MSPLLSHERYRSLIGQMVEAYTLQRRTPRHTGGSTAFKREAKKRGLEADQCYWIQHEPQMRSRKEFDPRLGPPPDLAIEVDITHSSLDRLSIYADLEVPEIWHFDGQAFSILLLREGKYESSDHSAALPELPADVVMRFPSLSDEMGEVEMMAEFVDWVREQNPPPRKARRPRKK